MTKLGSWTLSCCNACTQVHITESLPNVLEESVRMPASCLILQKSTMNALRSGCLMEEGSMLASNVAEKLFHTWSLSTNGWRCQRIRDRHWCSRWRTSCRSAFAVIFPFAVLVCFPAPKKYCRYWHPGMGIAITNVIAEINHLASNHETLRGAMSHHPKACNCVTPTPKWQEVIHSS